MKTGGDWTTQLARGEKLNALGHIISLIHSHARAPLDEYLATLFFLRLSLLLKYDCSVIRVLG